MNTQIYYLMSCDEWKDTDSMRLILITTSEERLCEVIRSEIEAGNMEYNGDTVEKMIANFNEDWKRERRDYINGLLQYGYYDYTHDGELM